MVVAASDLIHLGASAIPDHVGAVHLSVPAWAVDRQVNRKDEKGGRLLAAVALGLLALISLLLLAFAGELSPPAAGAASASTGGPASTTVPSPSVTEPVPDPSATRTTTGTDGTAEPTTDTQGLVGQGAAAGEEGATSSASDTTAAGTTAATTTESAGTADDASSTSATDGATDVALVRSIGIGLLGLAGLFGVVAVVAPRRAPVTLDLLPLPTVTNPTSATQTPAPDAPAPAAPAAATSATADTSLVAREPSVAQGIIASLLAAAGLLGVQETEGVGEVAISVLVAAIPLVGALFVRSRVQPVGRPAPRTQV